MNTQSTPPSGRPTPKPARRSRRSPTQWADLIAQHAASDLDVASFCNQHDVGLAGFYAWRRRLVTPHSSPPADPAPPRLVRLEPAPASQAPLTAHFPGGVRVEAHASGLVAAVAGDNAELLSGSLMVSKYGDHTG